MRDRANFFADLLDDRGIFRNCLGDCRIQPARLRANSCNVHAQCGQHLSDAVMQLAGDLSSFLVSELLQVAGEFAQVIVHTE